MKTIKKISLLILIFSSVLVSKADAKNKVGTIESKTKSAKITEKKKGFSKLLKLQGFKFNVSTTGEGSIQHLVIKPYGLKKDNRKIEMEIEGSVTNAEIDDLNADGYPELLIYTVSAGSGSYGNVIGYSVNKGKSMSAIYFPPVADNPKTNKGYMGHDEFAIGELVLIHRFKTYNEGDINGNPTGKIRQIQYKLKNGKDSRKFVIDKIVEY